MKTSSPEYKRSYLAALRSYLEEEDPAEPVAANALGLRAVEIGLETLTMAKIHEAALIAIVSPNETASVRKKLIRRAGHFFADAITPIELTHRGAVEANVHLKVMVDELMQRTNELTDSNQELLNEISRRQALEESLRSSEQTSGQLLEKSSVLQEELRLLSRRLISIQEEERKRISRELHDLIAQTLTGINLQLATLKSKALSDKNGFNEDIERAEQLVVNSVEAVHRFALDLRPAVLDDLGLIPALKSYLNYFMKETGIRVSLSAFAGVENLSNASRTVLYRVAQEALSNVSKHANASHTEVKIQLAAKSVCMEIHDNGKGFLVDCDGHLCSAQSERLGLLGMRERVEMVGGKFHVKSTPGKGTTVCVEIPQKPAKHKAKSK